MIYLRKNLNAGKGTIQKGERLHLSAGKRNNSYYFSQANQQKAGTKIYSLTQCILTVNECDWQILAGNDERINSHCLTRFSASLIRLA